MGYVYLLHAVGTDRYKIGMTVGDVQNRVYALQTGCPFELRVVATIESENAHTLESRLHHRFKAYRVQGEWFKFDQHTPGIAETFGVELTNTPCEVDDVPGGYVRLVDDSVKATPVIKTVTETVYIDRSSVADTPYIFWYDVIPGIVLLLYGLFLFYGSLLSLFWYPDYTVACLLGLFAGCSVMCTGVFSFSRGGQE